MPSSSRAPAPTLWAIVPFKGAQGAKKRLSPHLTEDERSGLVLAMMRDVLAALSGHPGLAKVLIVSRAAIARELAAEFAVEVYEDQASDLIGAVTQASDAIRAQAPDAGSLFVPGDVPLIRPHDIDAVLADHVDVSIVPDAHDIGTNAVACTPPNAFEYLFDGKSFKPHLASARRAGYAPRIVRDTAFTHDVDTIDELIEVMRRAAGTHTGTFLTESGIARRLTRTEQ